MNGLRNFLVLFCVAHRLNNILKRTFYQGMKKTNMAPVKLFTTSTNITTTEVTPTKIQRTLTLTTSAVSSPDISRDLFDDDKDDYDDDTEESSDDENDCDLLDYTESTIADLNPAAKQVVDTIAQCKALVKYVKKVLDLFSKKSYFFNWSSGQS